MNILIVDTCDKRFVVQLLTETAQYSHVGDGTANTSQSVLGAIDEVVRRAALTPHDLDVVAAAVGPGSFTGIRIGVSVCNGIAKACGAARLAVNRLDVLASVCPDAWCAIAARPGYSFTLADGEYGEHAHDEIAAHKSVGMVGSGAGCIVQEAEYDDWLRLYVRSHAGLATDEPLTPLYLKKSQAERQRKA